MVASKSSPERLVKAFAASIGIIAKVALRTPVNNEYQFMGYYVGGLRNRALSCIRSLFVYGETKGIVWRNMLTDLLKSFGKAEIELEVLADISEQDC